MTQPYTSSIWYNEEVRSYTPSVTTIKVTVTNGAGNPISAVNNGTALSDGDGLNNAEEIELGTDSEITISDGDNILDGQERTDSTNPIEPCSAIFLTLPADIEIESVF